MQTIWTNHVRHNPPNNAEIWELKYTKGTSIPFDAVKEHQREALLQAKYNGMYHKLTDPPIFPGMKTRFNAKRPFDCMFLKGIQSYVLLWFYKPRKKKVFIKIDIDKFLEAEAISNRKSLTEEMALNIGEPVEIVLN